MPEPPPLVVFGDDWGRHVSSMQHVFRPILERRPVVWVNAIGHRVPRLHVADVRRAWEKGLAMLRPRTVPSGGAQPQPSVVVQPRVLPWHNNAAVHALNTRALVRAVRGGLRAAGLSRRPVVVTGSPPSVGVLGRLDEAGSVYFCMDDFLHLSGVTASMMAPLERRLLQSVDAVVATAESLTRSKVPRTGRVHYLPQGVNYAHFAEPRPEPDDMRGIPGPRIGFAGGVSACCDLALIRRLAEAFPDASVVLVGPVTADLGGLERRNVHILDHRPYQVLPAYVQQFDVAIIPYLLTEWTAAVDPLKLLEYLAAGVPTVTTAIPEVAKYRDVITIATDSDAFVAGVARALASDNPEARARRQALAGQHTWERRADELLGILDEIARQSPATRLAPA